MIARLRALVEALCANECAGRAPGTSGSLTARRLIAEAFAGAGVDVVEQAVPAANGANLIATVGDGARAILVGAHYDHLGTIGADVYRGADDNAAAVAILVEVARGLAKAPPLSHRVIFCAFDAEEPPHFLTGGMGSEHFAAGFDVDQIDLAICMDLVGHALGPPDAPPLLRDSLLAFGAEKSEELSSLMANLDGVRGVNVLRAGINVLPPLSDYVPFQRRGVPFLFLTGGRWRHYHTPEDTPEKLDYAKMAATVEWLVQLVGEADATPALRPFDPDRYEDHLTLQTLRYVAWALKATEIDERIAALQSRLDDRLTPAQFAETLMLLAMVEARLA